MRLRGRVLEEAVEDLLSADLSFVVGVVSLGLQGGPELDGGDEEGAALAVVECRRDR